MRLNLTAADESISDTLDIKPDSRV